MKNGIRIGSFALVFALTVLGMGCSGASEAKKSEGKSIPAAASTREGSLVRRPGTSGEDGKVYLIQDGKKHWVLSPEGLKRHGYTWSDVKAISAEELAAIPEGEVIR